VSLSPVEDVTKSPREEDCDYAQYELETTDDGHEQGHTTRHDKVSEPQNHAEYPDESHFYPANVEANSDSPPPSPPPSEDPPDTLTPRDETGTPAEQSPPQKASPTPSLHLPPVTTSAVSSPLQLSSNHQKHKVTRSSGPSAFEKVVNKTRPPFLPPKSRDEDQKHLAVWEKMMKRSLAAGAQ
jgi:TBC1 domain family member 14